MRIARKNRNIRYVWVALGAIALLVAGIVFFASRNNIATNGTVVLPSGATTPSPSSLSNPGDTAKSAVNKATPTPAISTAPVKGFSIDQFAIEQPQPRVAHVVTTISGLANGSCKLILTSPSGSASSKTGAIIFDGHYNICSFSNSNVSEPGLWAAKLNVTDSKGVDVESQTTFEVS